MATVKIDRPSSVKVGIYTYQILWSEASWKKYIPEKMDDHIGCCLHRTSQLFVNGYDMALTIQKETLLHEILHCCLFVFGYADAPFSTENKIDQEEMVVRFMTPVLLGVLAENQEVVAWLTEK